MPVIPFLKRTGFLATDGTPTPLYARFRNHSQRGAAAAEALRQDIPGSSVVNEYTHALGDAGLKGVSVQATGMEQRARTPREVMGSFNALRSSLISTRGPAVGPRRANR